MPKMKTHKSTAKRMKITGAKKGAKVLHRHAGANRLRAKKSESRKRNISTPAQLKGAIKKNIKRVLGV